MTRSLNPIDALVPRTVPRQFGEGIALEGWCPIAGGAANIGGFLRDVLGAMAATAINGTHTSEMQQMVAAAACIEIARTLSPALGRFMESLCFPDEAGSNDLGRNLERYAPDEVGVRCLTTGEAMLPDVGLAAPQAEPHHALSCAVLDGDTITVIRVDHGSPLGSDS